MSKKDYAKKPKDYKGKRNGKPTLMALDPKSGETTSFEVVFEEVDLDEGTWRMPKSINQIAPLAKLMKKPIKLGKEGEDAVDVVKPYIGDDELYDDLYAAGKKNPKGDARPAIKAALKRFGFTGPNYEDVEIDEGTKQVLAHGGKGKYKVVNDGSGSIDVMFKGKSVGKGDYDRGAGSFFMSIKGEKGQKSFDDAQAIADYFAKNKITEEVELDEAKYELYHKDFSTAMQHAYKMAKKLHGITIDPKEIDDKVATGPRKPSEGKTNKYRLKGDKGGIQIQVYNKGGSKPFELNMYKEEVELDEGKQKPYVSSDRDGKHVMTSSGKIAKTFKDMNSANAYLKKNYDKLDEASKTTVPINMKRGSVRKGHVPKGMYGNAAKDARRAMRSDPDMKQRAFSKDVSATDDDVKGASKNIIMQMRKAQSLGGNFSVEFSDGKKVKIPAKLATAVQSKFKSLKKPVDKERFQSRISKSYKDMLRVMKEDNQPSETILERINKKLKENKNG